MAFGRDAMAMFPAPQRGDHPLSQEISTVLSLIPQLVAAGVRDALDTVAIPRIDLLELRIEHLDAKLDGAAFFPAAPMHDEQQLPGDECHESHEGKILWKQRRQIRSRKPDDNDDDGVLEREAANIVCPHVENGSSTTSLALETSAAGLPGVQLNDASDDTCFDQEATFGARLASDFRLNDFGFATRSPAGSQSQLSMSDRVSIQDDDGQTLPGTMDPAISEDARINSGGRPSRNQRRKAKARASKLAEAHFGCDDATAVPPSPAEVTKYVPDGFRVLEMINDARRRYESRHITAEERGDIIIKAVSATKQ